MPGTKTTNERPGTRAVLRYCHMSPYKARQVLDLIRGKDVVRAEEILRFSERSAAKTIQKLLTSAIANAEHNDHLNPEELYISACFADEAMTLKRWRPRARGRAGRIRKRSCHITLIVSRVPEDRLQRVRARQKAEVSARRARRVAGQRKAAAEAEAAKQAEPEVAEEEVAQQAPEDTAQQVPKGIAQQAPADTSVEADEREEEDC